MVLHYGQEIFEGLKVYAQPDGSLASFRPKQNAARLNRSADRLGIPRLPEELFLASIRELLVVDGAWVPSGGETSLYVRPRSTPPRWASGCGRRRSYTFCVIASPAGAVLPRRGATGQRLVVDRVRARPGGPDGAAKFGGNYAASLAAQAQAAEKGCDQVVWLDAVERRWVEEMGGMNLFVLDAADRRGGDARTLRVAAAGGHPGLVADHVPGSSATRPPSADLHRGVGQEDRNG